jgi:chromosome segregation ATPase
MPFLTVLLGFAAVQAATVRSSEQLNENPIRRIVNLLQMMAKEIETDGEKDEEMHEKYLCYCKTNVGKLGDGITELETQIPQIESSIEESISTKTQIEADLVKHKKDREDAKAAIAEATAQREKEATSFADESTEDKANIAACTKAIDAIAKGMAGMFLQSGSATALRTIVMNRSMDRYSRRVLTDFLSTSTSSGYAPASGEIVGILKQLLENMEGELGDITKDEDTAIAEFEALVTAKEKEIAAATEAIETKTEKNGSMAVKIVNLKNDLKDAEEALGEDQKFLAELKKGCGNAEAEYDGRVKARAEELVAVQETIKILNDDDALDLFKKTLPSFAQKSLLQMTSRRDVQDEALSALSNVQNSQKLGFIELALMGKKVNFDKVIKMMDDMVVLLGEEQKDDEKQKAWCETEFDTSEDKDASLKRKLEGLTASIEEMTENIAALGDGIKALSDGIVALDKSVAEATETRKAEHAEFVTTSAQNNAAVQLLGVAENRLNKFYNPSVYKAPERRELTEEERIYVNSGGVDPRDAEEAAAAQTGLAGTGITVLAETHVAPPPPPATAEAFKKKDAGGPTALIQKLANELKMEMKANEMDEKQAQKDYEELMAESAAKRAADSKTITEKESQKAGLEGDLEGAKADKKSTATDLMALGEYIAGLHGSCDFLLENFEVRKEARAGEIDAIKKAKAVLSGADYSLLQVKAFLARH